MRDLKLTTLKPVLFAMMGLPGAGKTHTAGFLADILDGFHIEADEFRSELFEEPDRSKNQDDVVNRISVLFLEKLLSKKIDTVFDGNSNTLASRKHLKALAKKYSYELIFIWVQTDVDTSFYRASQRDRRRNDDKHSVSVDEETFEALMRQLQSPQQHENYVVVSGKHVFKTQLGSIVKKLTDLEALAKPEKPQVFTPRPTQISSTRQTQPRRRITLS